MVRADEASSVWWQGRWYGVQLWINGTPAKGCVRLQAGDVLELKAYQACCRRPVAGSAVGGAEPVGDRAVVEDVAVRRAERRRARRDHHPARHSTSTYALAATCRAGRAAVDRWLAPQIPQLRQRSLWQLVGENWPLTVLHAKVDAMPEACEAELVEMLSPGSFWRGTGNFPFATYIQRAACRASMGQGARACRHAAREGQPGRAREPLRAHSRRRSVPRGLR